MGIHEMHKQGKAQEGNDKVLSTIQAIRSIQISEGNFDCFATAYEGECDQQNCCWRDECFEAAKASLL